MFTEHNVYLISSSLYSIVILFVHIVLMLQFTNFGLHLK
jgi:hypothetical protein